MQYHKSLISFLVSPAKLKIINLLLKQDILLSEREIARLLGVSHMTVNRTMRELEELHFVASSRIGRAYAWKVNRQSYAFQVFSKISGVISEINDPLAELKSTILGRLPLSSIHKLALFGSIARNDARSGSDIDLFALVEDDSAKAGIQSSLEQLGLLCLDKFGNMLSPYVLTADETKAKKNLKLLSEIESGILLYRRESADDGKRARAAE